MRMALAWLAWLPQGYDLARSWCRIVDKQTRSRSGYSVVKPIISAWLAFTAWCSDASVVSRKQAMERADILG